MEQAIIMMQLLEEDEDVFDNERINFRSGYCNICFFKKGENTDVSIKICLSEKVSTGLIIHVHYTNLSTRIIQPIDLKLSNFSHRAIYHYLH